MTESELRYNDFCYLVFVLGYDLLHDQLANSTEPECDLCFERCAKIVEEFMSTDEYTDERVPLYDAFYTWLKNNRYF